MEIFPITLKKDADEQQRLGVNAALDRPSHRLSASCGPSTSHTRTPSISRVEGLLRSCYLAPFPPDDSDCQPTRTTWDLEGDRSYPRRPTYDDHRSQEEAGPPPAPRARAGRRAPPALVQAATRLAAPQDVSP